jgi:glycosyltransferase involved in cell wall biosynthesis
MRLLFITGSYPSPAEPVAGVFVRQFVQAVSRLGHQCTVVAPVSLLKRLLASLPPEDSVEQFDGGQVQVLRPRMLTSTTRSIGPFSAANAAQSIFNQTVLRTARKLARKPEFVYGHFLYQAGYSAVQLGLVLQVPSVIRVGEGSFWTVEPIGFARARKQMRDATGFIANSTLIKEGLVRDLLIPEEKVRVFPNGVDLSRFHRLDRSEMRRRWGFPAEKLLILFVGLFDDLKGGARLVQAVAGKKDVALVMVGSGGLLPSSEQVLFKGVVDPGRMPELYGAADLFVLPTMEEGSCNAAIEAMACGLPIVTSNGRYMDDIVDDDVAVRVDPTDVAAIREAIAALLDNPNRREAMSRACQRKAKEFDINLRAKRAMTWLEEVVCDFQSITTEINPTAVQARRRESLSSQPTKTRLPRSTRGSM